METKSGETEESSTSEVKTKIQLPQIQLHNCISPETGVACLENESQLWIKEYCTRTNKEGRTYPVNFCPICGGTSNSDKVYGSQIERDYYSKFLQKNERRRVSDIFREVANMLNSKDPYLSGDHSSIVGPSMMASLGLEELVGWRFWMDKIPFIKFPSEWKVKITPPFAGAMIRFKVEKEDVDFEVSVYLDCYDILGYYGSPYWEVYPYYGDTQRISMDDVDGLLKSIEECFSEESIKEYGRGV